MAMPRKRPFADPNQYYAYIWRHNGKAIWVGQGKNSRCRIDCASNGGRPAGLLTYIERYGAEIEIEVIACSSKQESRDKERELIASLDPRFNTAPGFGGFKGMHSPEALANMSRLARSRKVSPEVRAKQRERMKGNQLLLGFKHSDKTKAKISEALQGREVSELCKQKARERMIERNRLNPPRKGKTCSPEHRRKLSEARKRRIKPKESNHGIGSS